MKWSTSPLMLMFVEVKNLTPCFTTAVLYSITKLLLVVVVDIASSSGSLVVVVVVVD